jgi:cell division septation protein DedD
MPEATAAAAASPSGQTYWVLVASFRQAREATALLDQLRGRGLPVREVRVVTSPRGVWHQVLVGPYPDAAAAARGQVLVRQIPGYADAHVISS